MEEVKHIIEVLKDTKDALSKRDALKLKDLSNQTIHSASVEQDETSITLAVITYSLSKIVERTNYQKYPDWEKFIKKSLIYIEKAIGFLEKNNRKMFEKNIMEIEKLIDKLSGNFKAHIQQVFEKARINKASRIYEHGISMERTAKLLGITLFELADYAGKTGIHDIELSSTLTVKKRLKYLEDLFK